jgi:hypothetical protein
MKGGKVKGGDGPGFGTGLLTGVVGLSLLNGALNNNRQRAPIECPPGFGYSNGRCRPLAGGVTGGKILNFKEFSELYLAGGNGRSVNDAVLLEAFALQK